jgi:hypothetical protein
MIKELISISNDLDRRGLVKEADDLDGVLKSVLKMIDDKSIDIKQTEEGDEFVFDLFIDNKGNVVGAEPASGDLGSTCIMSEEGSGDTAEGSEEEERSEGDEPGEQVELSGYTTENFEICPGAVAAFEGLSGRDLSEEQSDMALEAIQATDQLFELEKKVINGDDTFAVYKDDLLNAFALARQIAHLGGALSEDIGEDLSEEFEFLDSHLDAISIAILQKD